MLGNTGGGQAQAWAGPGVSSRTGKGSWGRPVTARHVGPSRGAFGQSEKATIVHLKSEYRQWHQSRLAQHRIDETFFNRTFVIPTPPQNPPLHLPTAKNLVNDLVNQLIAEIPVVTISPRNLGEKYEKQASLVTSWVNGYWYQAELTEILRQMLIWDAIRGCHVMRVLYDAKRWPLIPEKPTEPTEPDNIVDAPNDVFQQYVDDLLAYQDDVETYDARMETYKEQTQDNTPIICQVLDPMYVFWEPVMPPEKPKACVICYDRPVGEVVRQFPAAADLLNTMEAHQKVQWNEYWDETRFAYWIDAYGAGGGGSSMSRWVQEPTDHDYGFFPIIIDGPWVTPLEDAAKRYPSIYEPIRGVLTYESTLMTQMAWVIRKNAYAPMKVKSNKPDNQKPIPHMEPGGINYLEPDDMEEIEFLEMSGATVGLLQQLVQFVDSYVQKGASFNDVLRGTPGGKSGYQQAQIAAMARVSLTPLEHCVERTLRRATQYVLKLVPKVGEKIKVTGMSSMDDGEAAIGEKDVRNIGPVRIKMKTVLPIDESAKIANYIQLNAKGMLSAVTAARLSGIENPEEESARAMAEQLLQEPDVKKALGLQWLKENDPDAYQEYQKTQMQQMPPPGAPPGVPGQIPGPMGGLQGPMPGQMGPPPPGAPAQGLPPAPGGAAEAGQVIRQSRSGGHAPKRLTHPPVQEPSGGVGGLA